MKLKYTALFLVVSFYLVGCGFGELKKVNTKATMASLKTIGEFRRVSEVRNIEKELDESEDSLNQEKETPSNFKGVREAYKLEFEPKDIRPKGKSWHDLTFDEKQIELNSKVELTLYQFPDNEDGLKYFKDKLSSETKLTETADDGGKGFDYKEYKRVVKINCYPNGFCYKIKTWGKDGEGDRFLKVKLLTRIAFIKAFLEIKDEMLVYYE